MKLSEEKRNLLETDGNLLVLGGPGCGKTTIALLKGERDISPYSSSQKVLFLSFARSTVLRIAEKAKEILQKDTLKRLEISTYHGFAWTILKSHGYLLNKGIKLRIITPPEAASKLAEFTEEESEVEKIRLFENEGLIHFDLFAKYTYLLLSESEKIRSILCKSFPIIILDEFQDTNFDEWKLVTELGKHSTLIALADLEQRIYEFRGANPERIDDFIKKYRPIQFDFAQENHRSIGRDIVSYGNDILTGENLKKQYKDVKYVLYKTYAKTQAHLQLKIELINAIKRVNSKDNWSIAILVPTKNLIGQTSDFLSVSQIVKGKRMPRINHSVQLEMAGPSLAAINITRLFEKKADHKVILADLIDHMRGRNGAKKSPQATLSLTKALESYLETGDVRGKNRIKIVEEAKNIANVCSKLEFSGEPGSDWILIRDVFEESNCTEFQQIAYDSKFLRLLRKGAFFNSSLADLWRKTGTYVGSVDLVKGSLLQEHFSLTNSFLSGVHIMTIYASKGKEFDEVIIYEGSTPYRDKILSNKETPKSLLQKKYALRVAVTRSMQRTTILTPANDPSPLIFSEKEN